METKITSLILQIHQTHKNSFTADDGTAGQFEDEFAVFFRVTQTVDAGNGGDHNRISPGQKIGSGGKPQFIDFFIDFSFLFNIGIAPGNISFGLIKIIIGNEIGYGIFRKKFMEFLIKLSSQCFIVRDDQSGFVEFFYDFGHGEGLAAAGHPQKYL